MSSLQQSAKRNSRKSLKRRSSWSLLASFNVGVILLVVLVRIRGVGGLTMKQSAPPRHLLPLPALRIRHLTSRPLKVPRSVKAVVTRVVPPIPYQKETLTWKDQFRPRFAAREFLLGASIMCRLFPILMAASLLATLVRLTFLSSLPVALMSESSVVNNVPHMMDAIAKLAISNVLKIPPFSPVFTNLIGPTVEEISYRGFGHWLGSLRTQWGLLFFCILCKWTTPAVALSWTVLAEVLALAQLSLSKALPRIVISAIQIPAVLAIYKAFRVSKEKSKRQLVDNDDCDNQSIAPFLGDTPNSRRSGPLDHNALIARTLNTTNHTAADSMESIRPLADRAVSWNARWVGALCFGRAHLGITHTDSVFSQGMGTQKCIGTIVSSLLIESRLAMNRRTLWGAIGAHVTYNTLSLMLPLTYVISACLVWLRHVLHPTVLDQVCVFFLVAVTFTLHGLGLYDLARLLERMEARLAQSPT